MTEVLTRHVPPQVVQKLEVMRLRLLSRNVQCMHWALPDFRAEALVPFTRTDYENTRDLGRMVTAWSGCCSAHEDWCGRTLKWFLEENVFRIPCTRTDLRLANSTTFVQDKTAYQVLRFVPID